MPLMSISMSSTLAIRGTPINPHSHEFLPNHRFLQIDQSCPQLKPSRGSSSPLCMPYCICIRLYNVVYHQQRIHTIPDQKRGRLICFRAQLGHRTENRSFILTPNVSLLSKDTGNWGTKFLLPTVSFSISAIAAAVKYFFEFDTGLLLVLIRKWWPSFDENIDQSSRRANKRIPTQ